MVHVSCEATVRVHLMRKLRAPSYDVHPVPRTTKPRIDSTIMEALFVTLMILVVLLTGFCAVVVLYKLLNADS